MSEIIDKFYTPLLTGHGFIRDPDNQQYGDLGICWKLSPEVGEGTYWTYGQKDLYDIKIHNFSFHEDFMLEFSLPECLSITRYDSISGEELSPYRRLSAGCIKTFIGGYTPYKALIHKNIPIRSIGIEIAPAYYEDYLKKLYPEAQINPVDAFRKIDQTSDFPEMSRLLFFCTLTATIQCFCETVPQTCLKWNILRSERLVPPSALYMPADTLPGSFAVAECTR